jgi:hypothetical protein
MFCLICILTQTLLNSSFLLLGDLRNNFIDFGWDSFDDAAKLRKRTIELNNGRAAMMGILALMVHEQLGVSIIPSSAGSEYAF